MSYKATKPGLVCALYLSMHYMVLLFSRAPFYVLLVFIAMCSVFWLLWLSCQHFIMYLCCLLPVCDITFISHKMQIQY